MSKEVINLELETLIYEPKKNVILLPSTLIADATLADGKVIKMTATISGSINIQAEEIFQKAIDYFEFSKNSTP